MNYDLYNTLYKGIVIIIFLIITTLFYAFIIFPIYKYNIVKYFHVLSDTHLVSNLVYRIDCNCILQVSKCFSVNWNSLFQNKYQVLWLYQKLNVICPVIKPTPCCFKIAHPSIIDNCLTNQWLVGLKRLLISLLIRDSSNCLINSRVN